MFQNNRNPNKKPFEWKHAVIGCSAFVTGYILAVVITFVTRGH
jgi:hypothetical protein